MLKKGIYRTVEKHFAEEQHGGGTLRSIFYWFLTFYLPDKKVGLYGASRDYIRPYKENSIDMKGEITKLSDNDLEFYIYNIDAKENIKFSGQIIDDRLHLRYYDENMPGEVSYDIFEYVGE